MRAAYKKARSKKKGGMGDTGGYVAALSNVLQVKQAWLHSAAEAQRIKQMWHVLVQALTLEMDQETETQKDLARQQAPVQVQTLEPIKGRDTYLCLVMMYMGVDAEGAQGRVEERLHKRKYVTPMGVGTDIVEDGARGRQDLGWEVSGDSSEV
ncbi:hypothetical protein NDU88_000449 [Pleurodeles waltl]|uniref:Uncharacterized protein n=1 Tax=Pleurodeles waltl TaxID=8319 RepID=A0AAV7P0W7_PLEWA|nr:hypothetical protein NDU88_000449 [Pleurodeles waltl]